MSKVSLVVYTVCITILTGCSTVHLPKRYPDKSYSYSTPHSQTSYSQISKDAEFDRAYASLSDENRRLINKHVPNSYITTRKELSTHGSTAVKDILEYAQYLEQLKQIEIANRKEKEAKAQAKAQAERDQQQKQKKIQTDLAKKVDCNLFDLTDFIPGIGWLKGLSKVKRLNKIAEAQKRGLCK
ncbi:hypothetical protein MOMA_01815 [Moraxella macacae 0408225]|uniref:Lipoprotein n=1 Tax=Moraxella macacae 0408225 TaxID=1230338 RepID=L2F7S8_9GAMM|nr:hypothetical protein [Moraxella macacae]ELA09104.1 hypothetical protein MOMA_01815 [Moraxella macacae 0408225]